MQCGEAKQNYVAMLTLDRIIYTLFFLCVTTIGGAIGYFQDYA